MDFAPLELKFTSPAIHRWKRDDEAASPERDDRFTRRFRDSKKLFVINSAIHHGVNNENPTRMKIIKHYF